MLTPRECARLQGFPENFIIPVSNAQSYKQFGNSVCIPVIQAVGQNMIKYLERYNLIDIRAYIDSNNENSTDIEDNDFSKESIVYWTPKGKVYHTNDTCYTLRKSKTILSGSQKQSGKSTPCTPMYL